MLVVKMRLLVIGSEEFEIFGVLCRLSLLTHLLLAAKDDAKSTDHGRYRSICGRSRGNLEPLLNLMFRNKRRCLFLGTLSDSLHDVASPAPKARLSIQGSSRPPYSVGFILGLYKI
jgi:hypothetical protein